MQKPGVTEKKQADDQLWGKVYEMAGAKSNILY